MPNPVVHFEVTGKDGKKLQDWYANIFGWKVNADNPMEYGLVDSQGSGIAGGISAGENGEIVLPMTPGTPPKRRCQKP